MVYDPDAILADPTSHPLHKMYAEINIGIRDHGEEWSKCANCGDAYHLTPEWGDHTVCSQVCSVEFPDYLLQDADDVW